MEHQVTADQNGQTIHTSSGDTIRIQLEENPTTGYSWALEETPPFFSVQKNDYKLLTGTGIGGGGMRTIVLKVEQSGSSKLQLINRQPWSDDVYQTFGIQVQAV